MRRGWKQPLATLWERFRFLRFATVGAATSCIYAVIVFLAYAKFGFAEEIASTIAYTIAIPINFLGQKHLVFRSRKRMRLEILPYGLLHLMNIVISALVLKWGNTLFGNIWLGSAMVILVIPICVYLFSKFYVFHPLDKDA